jgi:hypothetical protein
MKKLFASLVTCLVMASTGAQAFIPGRNICGKNTAQWRKAHGMAVPAAFATAGAWLSMPHRGKHAGAVMVVKRPGGRYHVAVVLPNGKCHNPSSIHQGWRDVDCDTIWRGHWRTYVG